MIYLSKIESNFRLLKNKTFHLKGQDETRFVIKHCVYYEGIKQIKLTILKRIEDIEELTFTEKEFKQFVKNLKPYIKK
jgi:hypothetical protein